MRRLLSGVRIIAVWLAGLWLIVIVGAIHVRDVQAGRYGLAVASLMGYFFTTTFTLFLLRRAQRRRVATIMSIRSKNRQPLSPGQLKKFFRLSRVGRKQRSE